MDTGEEIGEDAVYLEDLEAGRAPVNAPAPPTTPAHIKKARKDAMRDEYALPAIEGGVESRVKMSDPRVATAEEFRDFIDELRPEDLDINSDFSAISLPKSSMRFSVNFVSKLVKSITNVTRK